LRSVRLSTLAGLALAPLLTLAAHGSDLKGTDPRTGQPPAPPPQQVLSAPNQCTTGTCGGDFGTAVQFVKTPQAAADRAKKEEKLVFVLHVSGNFETPKFT
jgi:hypothetical protein